MNELGENGMDTSILILVNQHKYSSQEKLECLGYGEWVEEADTLVFEFHEYKACIQRSLTREPFSQAEAYFGGYLCGYVRIPENHPFFRNKEKIDLFCHGDITFNEAHREHWIGFDCAHCEDLIPSMEFFKKKRRAAGEFEPFPLPKEFENFSIFNPVYRNMKYCIDECKLIIDQLIEIKNKLNVVGECDID
jgi:hypothetical protein